MSEWNYYFKYFMQRSQFDWDNAQNRRAFLDEFYRLIVTRVCDVPNLRAIFRPKQIELLLLDSMDAWDNEIQSSDTISFIKFVVKSGYRDEPELDEDGKPLVHRNTPVHYATIDRFHDKYQIVRELFKIYDNYDVNYTDESGFSHMHAAVVCCFIDIIEKFLEHGQDLNCLAPISGDSLLYVAVKFGKKAMVEFLWRRGIDPNLANAEGLTPLHLICNKYNDDMVKLFFRLNDENGRRLKFDVRDKMGRTPLLYAAAKKHMHEYAARVMLSNGADLNLTDDEGWTCLHWLCKWHALEGTKLFFRLSEEFNRPIAIDARDKLGNTPLHVTMRLQMAENPMELLLRQGADPNAVNAEGSTPLHLICMIDPIELHAETFFGTCDEIGKTVLIDAKDKLGRTPLQWAVENVLADKVDVLLDRGADLSSFVFPTEDYFNEKLLRHRMLGNHTLQLVTDALHIVERLEKGGYEMNRSDVLHIVKLFAKRGLFVKQHYDDEKFAQEGKEIMVIPGTSLYDLTRIKPEGLAAKTLALTLADYSKFVCTREYWFLRRSDFRGSLTHLAELAARGFFRVWALDCFMELTHCRLPSLCCEMIVDELTNQDLFNICLAACGESS